MSKITGELVRLNKYQDETGKTITEYKDTGWFREIQLFEDGILIHNSGPHHPENQITTRYKDVLYMSVPGLPMIFRELPIQ